MDRETRPFRVARSLAIACGVAAAALAMACGTYETVDGYDAAYVAPPPPDIETYPRYAFHDGYVYDVHGRYYHQHNGRWVAYRERPREITHFARR